MESKHDDTLVASSTLLFWHAIIDLIKVDSAYKDITDKFKAGAIQSTDFELLGRGAYPLFSMRLNIVVRLLATSIEVNSRHYLIFLEVSPTHYTGARFNDLNVLDAFMKKNLSGLVALINRYEEDRAKTVEASPKEKGKEKEKVGYKSATLHDKIISLSNEQIVILNQVTNATLISGAPGTGKSVLAQEIMDQELHYVPAPDEVNRPIVYITQSAPLAAAMEKKYLQIPHINPYNRLVQFKTIDQVIHDLTQRSEEHKHKQLVERNHFNEWLESYLSRAINKKDPALNEFFAKMGTKETVKDLIYQEFRILSGYTIKEYLNSEETVSSLFAAPEQRTWFANAYSAYQRHLDGDKAIHPAFFSTDIPMHYGRIIVDEVQDFSLGQVKLVFKNWDSRPVLLGDINQACEDSFAQEPYIKWLCKDKPFQHLKLISTYRCPTQVLRFANAVNWLKFVVSDGPLIKDQQIQIPINATDTPEEQTVHWYQRAEDMKEELLAQLQGSSEVVVITLEQHKEEARTRFKSIPIATITELKGLQFSWVIAYRVMDDQRFYLANNEETLIQYDFEKSSPPVHRSKIKQTNSAYNPPWSRLFTTVTRCTQGMFFIQKKHHTVKNLTHFIERKFNPNATAAATAVTINHLNKLSKLDWLLKAGEVFDNGNEAYAREIYINMLGRTPDEFKAWKAKREQTLLDKTKNSPALSRTGVTPAATSQPAAITDTSVNNPAPGPAPSTKKTNPKSPTNTKNKAALPAATTTAQTITLKDKIDNWSQTRILYRHFWKSL